MRYGYYLAKSDTMHGDPEYAQECKFRYGWLCQDTNNPSALDGVSRFGGTIRFVLRDYFDPGVKYVVRDGGA